MKKLLPWIVLGLIVFVLIIIQPLEHMKVAGQNMSPTYKDRQTIWINKPAYWFSQPQRNDIVIFNENRTGSHYLRINRIIAIPGDMVKIQNGVVYLNNQQLFEPYTQGRTEILDSNVIAEGKSYSVKENEYFVLGDNRTDSKYDSRSIGMINGHIKDVSNISTFIIGKVFAF